MFNKALFKQSCKANGIMWGIITFAVCFMLACVMLISGNGNVGNLRVGITNSIVEGVMDDQIQSRAINYYSLTEEGLTAFDTAFAGYMASPNPADTNPQQTAISLGLNAVNQMLETKGLSEDLESKGLLFGCYNLDLNGDGVNDFDYFYNDEMVNGTLLPYTTTLSTVGSSTRADERKEYAKKYASTFLGYNMVSEENVDKVLEQLQKYQIDREDFATLTYTNSEAVDVPKYIGSSGYSYVKTLARNSAVVYEARLNDAINEINNNDEITDKTTAIANARAEIVSSMGKGFLASLPADVSNSLEELGSMNLFGMIVGSIYFKMAGLLLPIIYIIMVSNNLIAGQVDSGSMAYVLSTSTKREEVTFTQGLFMVLSLFVMCLLTMLTSFVCLACVGSKVSITYGELALLSLGAFITLFAMSGISFLASCWFNRSKYSMSLGGGLNMFFLVATMLGLFGSEVLPSVVRLNALNFFNYCTIINLFDEVSILAGTTTFIWKLAILLGIGLICYIVGAIKFKKKDLPL